MQQPGGPEIEQEFVTEQKCESGLQAHDTWHQAFWRREGTRERERKERERDVVEMMLMM